LRKDGCNLFSKINAYINKKRRILPVMASSRTADAVSKGRTGGSLNKRETPIKSKVKIFDD